MLGGNMDTGTLNYCKSELQRLQEFYLGVLNRPMSGINKSIDRIDLARNESQIHSSAYFRKQMDQKLAQVQEALKAIEDGSYGICRITSEPISEKRLRAIPWTLTSIEAAYSVA
jgi:RNA polymerase-binding transcription factor DksA